MLPPYASTLKRRQHPVNPMALILHSKPAQPNGARVRPAGPQEARQLARKSQQHGLIEAADAPMTRPAPTASHMPTVTAHWAGSDELPQPPRDINSHRY
jgi:hypothetical protein